MLRPMSLDCSLEDPIAADRAKKEGPISGGGSAAPDPTPPPTAKVEISGDDSKKKLNRPGQRARRAAGKRAEKAAKEGVSASQSSSTGSE
eukprot:12355848-Alexandrium_andersonii.AAC.1